MSTTTFRPGTPTLTIEGTPSERRPLELMERYATLVREQRLSWTEHHRFIRPLGSGGQGIVYLSERRGADHFTLPVAVKIFSPERYPDDRTYEESMGRIAQVAARVAQIQQDNLLDVHNFVDRNRIRAMVMEWIDGYDLGRVLTNDMLDRVHDRVSNRRWEYLNNVLITAGPVQPRLKPGIAIAVLRGCLAALAALHREEIVHGDIKPSNIMLKRTGNAKIIDIGSAIELANPPPRRMCTPAYSAPEVLDGGDDSPQSDLASLGYVLIEMLSGKPLFAGLTSLRDLLEAKRSLVQRVPDILPREIVCNELLMNLIRGLIAADPMLRFPSAEAADLDQGAAGVHRQLVKGDLASEYVNEIRLWLEELE
jgi:serine/threonine protein kinase